MHRMWRVQAVANLVWAYSTLQYDHPQLYDSLAAAVVRLLRPDPLTGTAEATADGASSGGSTGEPEPGSSSSSSGGAGFSAQAVSMAAFSFAAANRCDSPAQKAAMLALAGRAEEILGEFTPQGLSNLAWGLTVAACYPPQVSRRCCEASWHAGTASSNRCIAFHEGGGSSISSQPPVSPLLDPALPSCSCCGAGARWRGGMPRSSSRLS